MHPSSLALLADWYWRLHGWLCAGNDCSHDIIRVDCSCSPYVVSAAGMSSSWLSFLHKLGWGKELVTFNLELDERLDVDNSVLRQRNLSTRDAPFHQVSSGGGGWDFKHEG